MKVPLWKRRDPNVAPRRRSFWASAALLLVACGTGAPEGHDQLGANDLYSGNDTIPAGETRSFAWQAVRGSNGTVGVDPLEVRFSASSGRLSVAVETTGSDGIATVDWTVGGQTGLQSILAEFYFLDGERSFGVGKESAVVPGKVASLTLARDSIVLFRGERFKTSELIAAARDSFGNVRSVGPLEVEGTNGIYVTVAGDSTRMDSAAIGGLVVHADLAADTIGVRVEPRYLLERPVSFTYACTGSNYDLVATGSVTMVAFPGDSAYYPSLPGLFQLMLSEQWILTYSGGQVDTTLHSIPQEVTRWRPDTVEYGVPGSTRDNGVGVRIGSQLIGGDWCAAHVGAATQSAPTVLTIH